MVATTDATTEAPTEADHSGEETTRQPGTESHESVPPAEPPRPRTILVGAAFAAAACWMFFGGLFGVYLRQRDEVLAGGDEWVAEGVIPLAPGSMMLITLLMSVVTMQWAVYAIARDDRPRAYLALALTLLFGVAVINQTTFVYTEMGLEVGAGVAALMIYVITGAHLVMLGGAMAFVALMAFRALAGQFSGRHVDGIAAAALFWYATVGVYAAIWYGIYVTK